MRLERYLLRIIYLVAVFQLICFYVSAQKTDFSSGELQDKMWVMQGREGKPISVKYTRDIIEYHFNGEILGTASYYLSDSIVTVFDNENVGKTTSGKFIVSRVNSKDNDNSSMPVTILEIVEVSAKELTVRNIKQEHTVLYKVE